MKFRANQTTVDGGKELLSCGKVREASAGNHLFLLLVSHVIQKPYERELRN